MNKTKLNTNHVFNELTGKSRFFEKAPTPSSAQPVKEPAIKQYENISILQLDEKEVLALRQSTHKAQTFRFTEQEAEWLKDTAYLLSKALPHRRVNQADIVRIGIKLFEKSVEENQAAILALIEATK